MSTSLKDKVALVSGASSGIGRATAIELAKRGAKVVVSARRTAEIEQLAKELMSSGAEAHAVTADMSRDDDVAKLVAASVKHFGRHRRAGS